MRLSRRAVGFALIAAGPPEDIRRGLHALGERRGELPPPADERPLPTRFEAAVFEIERRGEEPLPVYVVPEAGGEVMTTCRAGPLGPPPPVSAGGPRVRYELRSTTVGFTLKRPEKMVTSAHPFMRWLRRKFGWRSDLGWRTGLLPDTVHKGSTVWWYGLSVWDRYERAGSAWRYRGTVAAVTSGGGVKSGSREVAAIVRGRPDGTPMRGMTISGEFAARERLAR